MNLQIISAGAGSGKTYRLTQEMVRLLGEGVRANGIIATTFTKKAAAELQERVRVRLLEEGMNDQADALANALIGTVHGLGVKLLQRFAFEAGVAPDVSIIADEDQQLLFNRSLATVLTSERVEKMELLCDRLGLNKMDYFDWRKEVRMVTDIARANDFSAAQLAKSKEQSFTSFMELLQSDQECTISNWEQELSTYLKSTIARLEHNEDSTKKTSTAKSWLRSVLRSLELRGNLLWHEWAKLSKLDVGAKSKDDVEELVSFASTHHLHPDFQKDIQHFIDHLFEIAQAAIEEYDAYKKQRGLIDYTDMEVLVCQLLDNPMVKQVLQSEIDLLMVDEFQDTSPIQLEIFLKLSRLANHSVWVGDPKQSIYGFRGAAPELMQAIIEKVGGIRPEDIQKYSWRSREEIVMATNAIFCKAFSSLPTEQVALEPKRKKAGGPDSMLEMAEPIEMRTALHHWHFKHSDGAKRPPGKPWMENCIAYTLRELLDSGVAILPKGSKKSRNAHPGDVAILCRSNAECQTVAEALHRAGLKAAISTSGLLHTAEAKLILACLKYLINQYDSLSVAEILLLASGKDIEAIIEDRLKSAAEKNVQPEDLTEWGATDDFIKSLNELRDRAIELSSAEMLDLMLEELDLRRIIVAWGKDQQRLDNVEVLRKMALQYEDACNRLHTAASTGGFLLWLSDQEQSGNDAQSSGESPDAVNVLTYHKSKGLEWPVVICHSLEGRLRASVWGVDILSESREVDLDNVLANRWMRYWVNPYANQIRRTYLENRLEESEAQSRAREQARQEEARLLYVGITRARDYLIFPSRTVPTRWLNRVWHEGEEEFPTLNPDSEESPWEWNGYYLPVRTGVFTYDRDFDAAPSSKEAVHYFENKRQEGDFAAYHIDAGQINKVLKSHLKPGDMLSYGGHAELPEGVDQYQWAKAIKAFYIAFHTTYSSEDQLNMAEGFIRRYALAPARAAEMVRAANEWHQFLSRQFRHRQCYRKYPVRLLENGQLFSTVIDWVLEEGDQLVIIQNSGFSGTEQSGQTRRALSELGGWSHYSRIAAMKALGKSQCRVFIHFVITGRLIELVEQNQQLRLSL
jgi:ATP-dependent exoDNAse (exonuclease V) beta subunit